MKPWLRKILGGSVGRPVPLHEIRRSFDEAAGDEEHFPSTIDPRIYHVQLILEYFGDLSGKRILDVGCGKGRFARVLRSVARPRASPPSIFPKPCCASCPLPSASAPAQ